MAYLEFMIKPVSSLCDLRCTYCFYHALASHRQTPSFGRMEEVTVDGMLSSIRASLSVGDRVHFVFQGGEPTLAGLAFFRSFFDKVAAWKDINTTYALQTNGLHLDDEWCEFLRDEQVLVGVSLDLLPDAHNAARVDAAGAGSYDRVVASLARLRAHGVETNVLCTLTAQVALDPEGVWARILALDLDYVQFTPCLGGEEPSPLALTGELYASFYTRLFELWYADYMGGGRRSIKLFDDIVNQLLLGRPTACGMDGVCRPQLIIEADGSAYPCDFYCLDAYRLGNITERAPTELLSSPVISAFCARRAALPARCEGCRYRVFCGGGCPRMQSEMYATADGCGFQTFLTACGARLFRLAEEIGYRRSP